MTESHDNHEAGAYKGDSSEGQDHDEGTPDAEQTGSAAPQQEAPPPDLDLASLAAVVRSSMQSQLDNLAAEVTRSLVPKVDVTRLVPRIEYGRPDYGALLPKIVPTFDITALLPKLNLPDYAGLLEQLRRDQPPNWPHDVDLDRVKEVIHDDGIPLVWVPREKIVREVLVAPDRHARVAVLLAHSDELIDDCRTVLDAVDEPSLSGQLPLAKQAVEAFAAGYPEAAQALGVTVTETAVARSLLGSDYRKVKNQVLFDPELVPYAELRLRAALAPIHRFYTAWRPNSGEPAPEGLSRHVTVHQADLMHYTPRNALIAMLLVSSVLRALQELQEVAKASGDEAS